MFGSLSSPATTDAACLIELPVIFLRILVPPVAHGYYNVAERAVYTCTQTIIYTLINQIYFATFVVTIGFQNEF